MFSKTGSKRTEDSSDKFKYVFKGVSLVHTSLLIDVIGNFSGCVSYHIFRSFLKKLTRPNTIIKNNGDKMSFLLCFSIDVFEGDFLNY